MENRTAGRVAWWLLAAAVFVLGAFLGAGMGRAAGTAAVAPSPTDPWTRIDRAVEFVNQSHTQIHDLLPRVVADTSSKKEALAAVAYMKSQAQEIASACDVLTVALSK